MENVFVLDPTDTLHRDIFLGAITDVHTECITQSNTIATFLPPLSRHKMMEHYNLKASEISTGKYSIIMEWVPVGPKYPLSHHACLWQGRELAGYVMLNRTPSQTGPFRAQVEKLLVSSRYRKQGVARRLMTRLEEEARRTDSWLLMLDTEIGSGAEFVYPKLGYTAESVIPDYGISPKDNQTLRNEIFFYKDLRQTAILEPV